jgi:hypothetical protein
MGAGVPNERRRLNSIYSCACGEAAPGLAAAVCVSIVERSFDCFGGRVEVRARLLRRPSATRRRFVREWFLSRGHPEASPDLSP